MRTHLHIIILTLFAAFLPLQTLSAQPKVEYQGSSVHTENGTHYVLWDLPERTLNTIDQEYYPYSGPGAVLYFDAFEPSTLALGNLQVTQKVNGSYTSNVASIADAGQLEYYWEEVCDRKWNTWPPGWEYYNCRQEQKSRWGLEQTYGPYAINTDANEIKVYTTTGATLTKKVSDVKVVMAEYLRFNITDTTASSQELSVPVSNVKETGIPNTTSATIRLNWCNVGKVTITRTACNHQTINEEPVFSARIDANNPLKADFDTDGKWGYVDIEIICNHDVMTGHHGKHEGTFEVKDEKGHTRTIYVESHTYRLLPKLIWGEQLNPAAETGNTTGVLNAGTTVTYANVAHLDEQEIPLKFTSSNLDVIQVDEVTGDITAIQGGTAVITATSEGTRELEGLGEDPNKDYENTITIEVTEKTIQSITWLQPELYRQKIADIGAQITLTPTLSPDSSRPLVFEVLDTNVATVSGNTLTIKGKGVTRIKVTQVGDDDYMPIVAYHMLIVRDPNDPCIDLLYGGGFEMSIGSLGHTNWDTVYYDIDLYGAEPDSLRFNVVAEKHIMDLVYNERNELFVFEMVDGKWYQVTKKMVKTTTQNFSDIRLNRNATAVRFGMPWNNYGVHMTFSEVEITRARYLEVVKGSPVKFDPVFLGTKTDNPQTVTIAYSSLPDVFAATLQTGKAFSINKTIVGDGCGSTGEITITVDFSAVGLSQDEMGDQTDVLVITDEKQSMKLEIPISGYITKAPQTIIWNVPETNNIKTVDRINVPAATDVNLPTNYLTSDATIATINDTYELEIHQAGTVVITAQAAGNENYEPAQEVVKTFVISVTPYTVTGLALSDIAVGDALKTTTISATILDERGNALLDGGEWTFEDPEYKFPTKGVYPVKMTFTPTRPNFYSPEPYEEIVNITVHDPYWLPIVPGEGDVTPQATIYDNFLYLELDEHLAEGQDGYVSLSADQDVTVTKSQHILLNATADDWRTFVAPFDISEVSIIEVMVEPTGNADYQTTLEAQIEANKAFKDYIVSEIATNKTSKSIIEIMEDYKSINVNVAVYPLEHFDGTNTWTNNYYLYEGSDTWLMEDGKFIKSWNFISQDATPLIKKGKTYAIQFPWCPYCTTKYWDYWTNKFVLLSHNGSQVVEATNKEIELPNPVSGTAMMVKHTMFAEKTLSELHNAFVHNTETDFYEAITETTIVKPTTSIIYANVSSPSGARAKAIARTGEIIWEDTLEEDNENNGNQDDNGSQGGNVTTDNENLTYNKLIVSNTANGFAIQHHNIKTSLAIYNAAGQLISNTHTWNGEKITIQTQPGIYLIRYGNVTTKVLVR